MMIKIDGSTGEGGGQVVRSALALSALTQQAVTMRNIRAKRAKSGLLRQHLTCVKAAQAICEAEVEGAQLLSDTLVFKPQAIRGGDYHFAIGSAGSTMLVLQTILPMLMLAQEPSVVVLEGGTHNGLSPSFDYINRVFLPIIARMGPQVHCQLERYGFYPAGGGRLIMQTFPVAALSPIDCTERGAVLDCRATAIVADIPGKVAVRQLELVRGRLDWTEEQCRVSQAPEGQGPGNCLSLQVTCEHVTEMAVAYGHVQKRSSQVVNDACQLLTAWQTHDVFAGEFLADQLLLPFALAQGGRFTTIEPSLHATTNLGIINQFLGTDYAFEALTNGRYQIAFGNTGGDAGKDGGSDTPDVLLDDFSILL